MAVDRLLDAAADLIDDLGAELHDVERVEHRGGVGELVVDGVLVAVERVQARHLDSPAERVTALLQPVGVGLPGPAGAQVQQPRPGPAVAVGGEVDHPGKQLRSATAGVEMLGVDEHIWHHVSTKPVQDGGRGPKELTGMVDLTRDQHGQVHARLLDLVPGRSGQAYRTWLVERGEAFRAGVKIATLDPFHGYKNAIDHQRSRTPSPCSTRSMS